MAQLRQVGTVKWFNTTKGFGFITPDGGGEDLFVHQTNINSDGFRSLREGGAVEFEIEAGPDGRSKAANVSGPEGVAPQGAPRSFGRGRGGCGVGGRGGPGRGPPGYPPGAYGAYPQMPPMTYGFYYFPTAEPSGGGGRGGGRGRGMLPPGMLPPGMLPQGMLPQGMLPQGMPPHGMMSYPGPPGAGQAATGELSGMQVVVHNLPWTCTWQQLKDIFKEWRVKRADVVYDVWGRSRGFGTVRLYSKTDAEAACEKLVNSQIEGRTISVRIDRFA